MAHFDTDRSLGTLLVDTLDSEPDAQALVFLADDNQVIELTRAQFKAYIAAAASQLRPHELKPGDIVVLALPHSLELLAYFWAVICQGAVPSIVSAFLARANSPKSLTALGELTARSGAALLLTTAAISDQLSAQNGVEHRIQAVDPLKPDLNGPALLSALGQPDGIAHVQFTSGTTAARKLVPATHRKVVHCLNGYIERLKITEQDVVVNWMPLYHDFGLFAGFVLPLLFGIPLVLMSVYRWVRSPQSLLQAIQTYQGTLCWTNNFGVQYMANNVRARHKVGLDLSSLRVLGCGGEQNRLESQAAFETAYRPHGLRRHVFTNGYGLAETVFVLATTEPEQPIATLWIDVQRLQQERIAEVVPAESPGALAVMSCGAALNGIHVQIQDRDSRVLADRQVGEVVLSGSYVFDGYLSPSEAKFAGSDRGFRSGDLGFLQDGQIFLVGRQKDLIIAAGENVYPELIEALAVEHPDVLPDQSAAFGVYDDAIGSERLVLVCGVARGLSNPAFEKIHQDIRQTITTETGLVLGDLKLVRRGWIVKTENGKIARGRSREKYLLEAARHGNNTLSD
jgi:acyl-CoA synthetase (AMP-forming)/AMP-acid ligase II